MSEHVGECVAPVRIECTGAGHAPHEVLVRCGTRVASKCEPCSKLYAQDARAIIYDGLDPSQPYTFITLTAPSFGRVHTVAKKARPGQGAKVRRCACGEFHEPGSDLRGVPLNPFDYDYEGAVRWNANAGRLWDRFKTQLNRRVGVKLEMLKVAEWQERGSIHLHVLVRGAVSAASVRRTAEEVFTIDPASEEEIRFGSRLDVQVIPAGSPRATDSRAKTGGYIAKLVTYVAKDLSGGKKSQHAKTHFALLEQQAERLGHTRASRIVRFCDCARGGTVTDSETGEVTRKPVIRNCKCARVQVRQADCDGERSCKARIHGQHGWRGHVLTRTRGWSEKNFTTEKLARRAHAAAEAALRRSEAVEGFVPVHFWGYAPEGPLQQLLKRERFKLRFKLAQQ